MNRVFGWCFVCTAYIFSISLAVAPAVALAVALAVAPAVAKDMLTTYTPDRRPFLQFNIYNQGEVFAEGENPGDPPQISTWTLLPSEVGTLQKASDYWASLIGPKAANTQALPITVGTYDQQNADAGSSSAAAPWSIYTQLAAGVIFNAPAGDEVATIRIGNLIGGEHQFYTGAMEVLPHNGNPPHLASILVHEIGHAMGISSGLEDGATVFPTINNLWAQHLVDANGNPAQPNQPIVKSGGSGDFILPDAGYAFFKGTHVSEVLQGAMLDPNGQVGDAIPINGWEDLGGGIEFPELSHIELQNSMMSHQNFRNYAGYMEAELALLQDIGYTIDRKNLFGYSVYGDNLTLTNTNGYWARTADGTAYIPQQYNTALMGIGLHIYGSNNNVTQTADILSSGFGAAGIRVDGNDGHNTVTIARGVRVHANGELGTGLMVAYGSDHVMVQRGELSAIGSGGVGARFDFGSNMLGDLSEFRGSYIDWSAAGGNLPLPTGLDAPLVKRFDVTGPIAGDAAAIYISGNAYVQQINIMNGAALTGNIISRWNPLIPVVQYATPQELMTDLSFGRQADTAGQVIPGSVDPAFAMTYHGNITGPNSLNMSIVGGRLSYRGMADVANFSLNSGATLDTPLLFYLTNPLRPQGATFSTISADTITLQAGSQVSVTPPVHGFGYGPKLASRYTALELNARKNLDNQSTVVNGYGDFAMGAYDYVYSVHWLSPSQLELDTHSSFNTHRGGTAAVTAPAAMMMQNPLAGHLFDRMRGIFSTFGQGASHSQASHSLIDVYVNGFITSRDAGGAASTADDRTFGSPREYSQAGDHLGDHPVWSSFLSGGEMRMGDQSLWVTPAYAYTTHSGRGGRGGRVGYDISTPAWSMGYDSQISHRVFLGLAVNTALPSYSSTDADIDGNNVTGALYGGVKLPWELELSAFASYGYTNFDQTRRVYDEKYDKHYDANNWSLGASLGRAFALTDALSLRPFASYEFLNLSTQGYTEGEGMYSLHVGSTHNELHKVVAGGDITWSFDNGIKLNGRLDYTGLYGDRASQASAFFTQDPGCYSFASIGDALDENSLGIGLGVQVPLSSSISFSAGYNLLEGEHSTTHQGNLNLTYSF